MGKHKKSKDKEKDKALAPQEELKKLRKKVSKVMSSVEVLQAKVDNGDAAVDPLPKANKENDEPNTIHLELDEEAHHDAIDEDDSGSSEETEKEWLEIMGDDPSVPRSMTSEIRPELCNIWKFYCREGMKKDEEVTLMEKYVCALDFQSPKLNPQISAAMKETAKARDGHMVKIQDIAGLVLTVTGSLMTKIYDNRNEGLDLTMMLEPLKDIAKLTSLIMNKQSSNRKAFIEPGLNKETVTMLKDTKVDNFLYGKELSLRIKESKALTKEGEGLLKLQQPSTPKASRPSNFNTPYRTRPRGMGYTSYRGQVRPKFSFKGKQQFVNHRAQNARGRTNQIRQPLNQTQKET